MIDYKFVTVGHILKSYYINDGKDIESIARKIYLSEYTANDTESKKPNIGDTYYDEQAGEYIEDCKLVHYIEVPHQEFPILSKITCLYSSNKSYDRSGILFLLHDSTYGEN